MLGVEEVGLLTFCSLLKTYLSSTTQHFPTWILRPYHQVSQRGCSWYCILQMGVVAPPELEFGVQI